MYTRIVQIIINGVTYHFADAEEGEITDNSSGEESDDEDRVSRHLLEKLGKLIFKSFNFSDHNFIVPLKIIFLSFHCVMQSYFLVYEH